MIVDSSALIAILFREPERETLLNALSRAAHRKVAAPTWLETCMVVDRRQSFDVSVRLDQMRRKLGVDIVPFDEDLASIARDAFEAYGRGTKHPAKLNFGDCMAYALAKQTGEPLLFKGNDFIHTDITPALH